MIRKNKRSGVNTEGKAKKIKHIKLREPGGSINSEKIRKLILNKKSNFNQNTDLLLYLASRSENVDKIDDSPKVKRKHKEIKLIPLINKGVFEIKDRDIKTIR